MVKLWENNGKVKLRVSIVFIEIFAPFLAFSFCFFFLWDFQSKGKNNTENSVDNDDYHDDECVPLGYKLTS